MLSIPSFERQKRKFSWFIQEKFKKGLTNRQNSYIISVSSRRTKKTFKKEIFDMKKFLTLMLAVLMLVSSVVVLSSCGAKPKLNLEKAEEALKDNDYMVSYSDDIDEAGIEETLSAYKKDDSLVIVKFAKSSTAKLYYQQMKMELDYEIESIELKIKTTKHMLDKYEKDLDSDEIDELEDELKELEKELEETKEDYVIGRSGKYVWYGTEDAIKDSKG